MDGRRCRRARFVLTPNSPFGRWGVRIEADDPGSWESTVVRVLTKHGRIKRVVLSCCLTHDEEAGIYAIQSTRG